MRTATITTFDENGRFLGTIQLELPSHTSLDQLFDLVASQRTCQDLPALVVIDGFPEVTIQGRTRLLAGCAQLCSARH